MMLAVCEFFLDKENGILGCMRSVYQIWVNLLERSPLDCFWHMKANKSDIFKQLEGFNEVFIFRLT